MRRASVLISALILTADLAPPAAAGPPARPGVPAPWTPVKVDGDIVRCWGREHRVEGPLPKQIVSQGKELLAGPVALRLDGEPAPAWERAGVSATPRAARWQATAGRVRARAVVEYDGFWDIEVEVGRGPLKGLALEIPLAAGRARYLHFVNETHYQEPNTVALGQRDGELWADRFACAVWVGDEEVGLQWCADTDAPFRLKDPRRAVAVRRAGAAVTLRVTLVDHETDLKEPLRWRFGLIATPVRPYTSPRWRDWRLGPGPSANVHVHWWPAWAGSHADTVPKDPAALRREAAAARRKGHYLLPYVSLLALSEKSAAYPDRGTGWRRQPHTALRDEGTPYWLMCPNTGWADFFPREMESLVRGCGLNGLYYDFVFPLPCDDPAHPCGYAGPGGRRRGEFRVFKMRELARDTYERVKAVQPDSLILVHCSDALLYPCIPYGDLMLVGEEKRGPVQKAKGRYMDVLPLEELRAEYRGHHAGLAPFLIPEFATPEGLPDPGLTGVPGPTSELLALALLHDVGVWPIYCHEKTVEAVRVAQRDFGTAGAEFKPYWAGPGPVEVDGPGLLASAWVKPDGVLAVIANRSDRPVEARLRSPRGKATDALTREGIEGAFTVPARGFRLVGLTAGPPR